MVVAATVMAHMIIACRSHVGIFTFSETAGEGEAAIVTN
jgi:hypothetical protein